MQYKHIRDDKEIKDKEIAGITALSVLIPIGLTLFFFKDRLPVGYLLLIIVPILYFIPKLVRTLYSDWVKERDIIGFIEIEPERIFTNIDSMEIDVNKIVKMEIKFNYIKGKRYNHRDIFHNGLAEFLIDLNDGRKKRIVFLIETKKQLESLSLVLKEYYRKRIEIKEFFCRHMVKTILLNPKWNYKELQNLKQELNIDIK